MFTEFANGLLSWALKTCTDSTINGLKRENFKNHEIFNEIEFQLDGSMNAKLKDFKVEDGDSTGCFYYFGYKPLILKTIVGETNGVGIDYQMTNVPVPAQFLVRLLNAKAEVQPIPMNALLSAQYLYGTGGIQLSSQLAAANMIFKADCFLGKSLGFKWSALGNIGRASGGIKVKSEGIETYAAWKVNPDLDVALKFKHCPHYDKVVAKLEFEQNSSEVTKKYTVNTQGGVAVQVAKDFGRSRVNLKGSYNVKNQQFGFHCGIGGSKSFYKKNINNSS